MEDDENEDGTRAITTRIFVGGLGESVREEDMEHIFTASLGKVQTIDFIRTKGRSFAYLDFLPSSPKSLPKLFSTYNGCVWKGGRLKLDKAKEHYLVRLKREWEEDAEIVRCAPNKGVDADKSIAPLHSSNKFLKSEKTQLHIFFPKLQKVKSLPFSGSGKHKYSFQQVEVPPLPIHFCDCEEHYVPSHKSKGNQLRDLEAHSGGINEEELNMMKSVMNKFLQRENTSSKAASRGAEFVEERNGSVKLINDPLLDDNEATDEEDEDNLVINIVRRGDKRMTLSGNPEKVTTENQESKFKQFQGSNDETTRNMLKFQERDFVSSNKKRKSLINEESDKNESVSRIPKRLGSLQTHARDADILLEPPDSHQSTTSLSWSQKSSWKALLGDNGNNVFSISHVFPGGASRKEELHRSTGLSTPDSVDSKNQDLSDHGNFEGQSDQSKEPAEEQSKEPEEGQSKEQEDGQSKELEELAEDQVSNAVNNLARGASWLQKSSWTQLVSEMNNNSFSISQILPGVTFEKTELPKSNSLDVSSFTHSRHCNLVQPNINDTTRDGIKSVGLGEGLLTAPGSSNIVASHKDQNSNALNGEQGTVENNKEVVRSSNEVSAPAPRTSIGDMEIAGTGAFMRSAASIREWAKTKAVLSGSAKRKYNDK